MKCSRSKWMILILPLMMVCPDPGFAQPLIKALTYNIRLKTKTDGVNYWPKRKEKVFAVIQKQNPDVLGMQEVLYPQLKDLQKALSDYHFIGVGRSDGKKRGEFSPVFFKKDRFDLLDSGTFWLSASPDQPGSIGWDAAITRICSWAKLKCKVSGKIGVVFNTHFDHKGKTARTESSKLIASKAREIAGDLPYCIMGDFNFTPDAEAYRILTESEKLSDWFVLPRLYTGELKGTFSGFRVGEKSTLNRIDYFFGSAGITAKSINIISDNDGTYYPSDHLPVVAEFEMK